PDRGLDRRGVRADPPGASGRGPGRGIFDLRDRVHGRGRLLPPAWARFGPDPMKRWRRALVIVTRLTPFLLAFLRDRRRWILFGGRPVRKPGVHEKRAEKLTATLAALGPTFIKLAQVFSARA